MLKNIIYASVAIVISIACILTRAATITQIPAPSSQFLLPAVGNDLIGQTLEVKTQQTADLAMLAQQYDLGVQEMFAANPNRTHELFNAGNTITLPKQYILPPEQYRHGIVVNISELRLYYFEPNGAVLTFPVALGRDGWRTPLVETTVYRKQANPTWHIPASIHAATLAQTGQELPDIIPPGPENPLGHYALYLAMNGYLIHGTNNPSSIGTLASSGCIRLYNSDIEQLFNDIKPGTPVHIINYPIKAGWQGSELYLEAHKPVEDVEGYYQNAAPTLKSIIQQATVGKDIKIDWKKVNKVVENHTGIPVVIGELKAA